MSQVTLDFIEEGFRTESTPTGQKWRAKKIPNGQQILVEEGEMRRSFSARVGRGQFKIDNTRTSKRGRLLARIHQKGYKPNRLPARPMWPSANRLPAKYIRAYTSLTQKRYFRIISKGKKK